MEKSGRRSRLAPNESLHYITITISLHESGSIVKHLQVPAKQVEKSDENVLSTVESSNGDCYLIQRR